MGRRAGGQTPRMEFPELVPLAALEARGEPRERAPRLAAGGQLVRVRRGFYAAADAWSNADAAARQVVRMRAVQLALGSETVFSHTSAALVHGIPLIGGVPSRPHLTVRVGSSKTSAAAVRTQRDLDPGEIELVDGFRVTALLRTVLDLVACSRPLAGLVAVSHARRFLGLGPERLLEMIERERPFRGARPAERAVLGSTDASDSPLETLVLTRCRDLGFAEPEQQREVAAGRRRYRVDFAWEDGRIVLEADGRGKYEDPELTAGRSPVEVVLAEKRREDAIRRRVERFARVTWADAWDGVGLARVLEDLAVPRTRPPRPLTM